MRSGDDLENTEYANMGIDLRYFEFGVSNVGMDVVIAL